LIAPRGFSMLGQNLEPRFRVHIRAGSVSDDRSFVAYASGSDENANACS
jgi:hypothetical protein